MMADLGKTMDFNMIKKAQALDQTIKNMEDMNADLSMTIKAE